MPPLSFPNTTECSLLYVPSPRLLQSVPRQHIPRRAGEQQLADDLLVVPSGRADNRNGINLDQSVHLQPRFLSEQRLLVHGVRVGLRQRGRLNDQVPALRRGVRGGDGVSRVVVLSVSAQQLLSDAAAVRLQARRVRRAGPLVHAPQLVMT